MTSMWQHRTRNAFLFTAALLSLLRYGKRTKIPANPRAVLVVHLAKLGDMVCFTPVLRALRKNLPETKIIVLGDAVNKELLEGSPDVDEYMVCTDARAFSFARELACRPIDIALIRGTGFVGLALALCAGIPLIITSRLVEGRSFATRTYHWLLPYVKTVDASFGEYMPRQYLRLLEPLGIRSDDTTKHLAFSQEAKEHTQAFLREHGLNEGDLLVGVSPSAGNKIKEWPVDRFAAVADHLIENYRAKIILIGGPKDAALIASTLERIRQKSSVSSAQGHSIERLKALIARLSLFISVDTGPIYIAEAFGVPTVDIVGPVDEREQPPRGQFHRVVVPERKEAEVHILNARLYDREEATRQTLAISAEAVCREVDGLLADMQRPRVL